MIGRLLCVKMPAIMVLFVVLVTSILSLHHDPSDPLESSVPNGERSSVSVSSVVDDFDEAFQFKDHRELIKNWNGSKRMEMHRKWIAESEQYNTDLLSSPDIDIHIDQGAH
jgi:hypothetical protein